MGYTYVRTVLMVEGRRDPATHAKYVRTYVSTYVRTYVDMGGGKTFPLAPHLIILAPLRATDQNLRMTSSPAVSTYVRT